MCKLPPSLTPGLDRSSLSALGATTPPPAPAADPRGPSCPSDPEYAEAIQRTSDMVWDEDALRLAQDHGLDLVNLTWEDTGRYYNSSVGPEHLRPDHPGAAPTGPFGFAQAATAP